jgi:hypothetical protein
MKSTFSFFFFIILFFTPLLFVQAQSKKEQIETLIFQKDSLFIILEKERQLNSDQVKGLKVRNQALNDSLVRIIEKERQTSIDIVKLLEDKIDGDGDLHLNLKGNKKEAETLCKSLTITLKSLHYN